MALSKYEIFLKVVEAGSITEAARQLNYTQAGVSHAVAAVEREAGTTLFVREARGVEPNEAAWRLIPALQTISAGQRALGQAINEINGVVAGTLRVGTFTSVSTQWLPQLVRDFSKRYPNVSFELLAGGYDEIQDALRTGRVDCGFLTAPIDPPLQFLALYEDELLAIVPPGHDLAQAKDVDLKALASEPFIMPVTGSDKDILAVFNEAGLTPQVRYALNDDFSAMAMVAEGFGVTLMPRLILRNSNFWFATRPLREPCYREIGIALPSKQRTTFLARTFATYLKENPIGAW